MLGRRNAQNVVGKNWNNSLPLSRQKPPERVSEVRGYFSKGTLSMDEGTIVSGLEEWTVRFGVTIP